MIYHLLQQLDGRHCRFENKQLAVDEVSIPDSTGQVLRQLLGKQRHTPVEITQRLVGVVVVDEKKKRR